MPLDFSNEARILSVTIGTVKPLFAVFVYLFYIVDTPCTDRQHR